MGTLIYDDASKVEFADRALAHLQVVIAAKLRRGESFNFSWANEGTGTGRTTVWMHPAIPLVYEFDDDTPPTLNRAWVEQLMVSANSSGGLHLMPEPDESPRIHAV